MRFPTALPAPTSSTADQRHRSVRSFSLLAALVALTLSLLATGAGAEPVPVLPPGVTISVNGVPMTGDDGGKVDGCTFTIAVEGLDPQQSPTTVGVKVNAVAPTAPEGSPITLVDHSTSVDAATWSEDLVMDDLVAPLPMHANGYHLRVLVSLDGTLAATSVYWLGCGAEQTGTPTRILFAVEWEADDGATTDIAPDAALPAGWRDQFLVEGSSQIGTATCSFLPDLTQLACVYDNPGHGDQPGLVVPGNPRATYDVSASGIPAGWSLDPATVGTFVGRETCPRDHEEPVEPAAEEGPFVCTHVVRLVQDPPEPTTTTTTTTAPPASVAPTSAPTTAAADEVLAAGVERAVAASGTLPATGSSDGSLALAGSLLLLAGGAAVGVSTRLRRASGTTPGRSLDE